ncbi:Beta-1,3-galactosyltransferase 1 [Bulinus truncatus]|nr:Beta-1,3-galactosyltransferase 1 [Bulinus truncatus]
MNPKLDQARFAYRKKVSSENGILQSSHLTVDFGVLVGNTPMVSKVRLLNKITAVVFLSLVISLTVRIIILRNKSDTCPVKKVYKYRVRQDEDKLFSAGFHQKSDFLAKNVDILKHWFNQMEESLKNEQKSIISFLSQPIINDHNFLYLNNPSSACVDSKTEVLIVVPSAPGNFQKKYALRNSNYGAYVKNKYSFVKILFFLGSTKSTDTQRKIEEESITFHDIVQESFEDNYHNIRFKAVSMLKWASTYCRQAKYVIRNDDDIIENLTSVVEVVKRTSLTDSNFILGRLRFNECPKRHVESKYYLSEQEFPEPIFPPFALGGLLGYPMLTVELLYQAALRVKPIWLDDVFITGMCGQKVGVELIADPAFIFEHE